jgi:hypothetical protein
VRLIVRKNVSMGSHISSLENLDKQNTQFPSSKCFAAEEYDLASGVLITSLETGRHLRQPIRDD